MYVDVAVNDFVRVGFGYYDAVYGRGCMRHVWKWIQLQTDIWILESSARGGVCCGVCAVVRGEALSISIWAG
jgi:hypothetical protein